MDVIEELAKELIKLADGTWPAALKVANSMLERGFSTALPSGWEVETTNETLLENASADVHRRRERKKVIRHAFFVIEEVKDMQSSFGGGEVPEEFRLQLDYKINDRLQELVNELRGGVIVIAS